METEQQEIERKKRRTLWWLSGLTLGMFGFGFALVPLYGLLCQVTGIQSVEQRAAISAAIESEKPIVDEDRWITVKFSGITHPDLPWDFKPLERKIRVHPGETGMVSFVAENRSSRKVTGQALPSVAPFQANDFFSKMECFCFTQQTLEGGERKEMPLRFVVSPDLPEDIASLTLSYNFMRVQDNLAENGVASR